MAAGFDEWGCMGNDLDKSMQYRGGGGVQISTSFQEVLGLPALEDMILPHLLAPGCS